MKFYVPHTVDEAQAEEVYQSVRAFVTTTHPPTDRRIHSVTYKHNGKPQVATVGELETDVGEEVIIILEASHPEPTYMICTVSRGVAKGAPVVAVDPQAVVTDFEDV